MKKVDTNKASILSRQFLKNPYPFYHQWRNEHPILWLNTLPQPGWVITGYKEVKTILLKHQLFRVRSPLPRHTHEFADLKKAQKNMMLYQNDEQHQQLRTIFQPAFTHKMLEDLRPLILQVVDQTIDQLKNRSYIDVVSDVAYPIPSFIISEILGIPSHVRPKIQKWTYDLLRVIDFTRTQNLLHRGNETIIELTHFFHHLYASEGGISKDSYIRRIAEKEGLDEKVLASQLILLLVAGHETTVNLIANALYHLHLHNSERMKCIQSQEMIPFAVEEVLRYESPTQITARYATEDVVMGDKTIKRGHQVYLFLGAANRDPNIFQNPSCFKIDRRHNPHLAFGAGSHFCIGSQLARMEAQITIERFFQTFPNSTLDEQSVKWRRLIGFRALKSCTVTT